MHNSPNPNQAYINIQNEFNVLGWPSQGNIKNIAIINGSNNGTGQTNINPGDKILDVNYSAVLVSAFASVFSNAVNANGRVSKLEIFTGPIPTTVKYGDYNFGAFNYDVVPGGWEPNQAASASVYNLGLSGGYAAEVMNIFNSSLVNSNGRDTLGFVPTFSAIASTSPRLSQSDLFRSEAASSTPFDIIYSQEQNIRHTSFGETAQLWWSLLINEFGIALTTVCTSTVSQMPRPSTPRIDTDYYFLCEDERRVFWVQNPSDISNLYDYRWTVYGPGTTDFIEGETMTMRYPAPGIYTLELKSHFNDDRIRIDGDPNNQIDFTQGLVNGPASFAHTRYVTVYASSSSQCSSSGGGGPIPERSDISFEDNFDDLDKSNTTAVYPNRMEDNIYVNFTLKLENKGSQSIRLLFSGNLNFAFSFSFVIISDS